MSHITPSISSASHTLNKNVFPIFELSHKKYLCVECSSIAIRNSVSDSEKSVIFPLRLSPCDEKNIKSACIPPIVLSAIAPVKASELLISRPPVQ